MNKVKVFEIREATKEEHIEYLRYTYELDCLTEEYRKPKLTWDLEAETAIELMKIHSC